MNLLRDPRWGRNEEGYSEDPLLTATMGTAFCQGLSGWTDQSGDDGGYLLTAPTLKHFLGYNNEDFRDLTSSGLRARVLHEYDLPPFRAPIEAGAATGVMPSYNLVNGRPAHVSPLLGEVRDWTDEELLICSDAWAPSNLVRTEHYFDDHPEAHAAALRAGLDSFTDHDGDGEFTAAQVTAALDRGLVTMDDVDRAVRRKLLIRLRLGEFDPDGGPFATAAAMDTPAHRELALAAARRAAVLLKNDGLLPLADPPSAHRRRRPAGRHPLRGLVRPGAALPGHGRRRPRRGRHRARRRRPGPHRPRRLRRLRLGRRHRHAARRHQRRRRQRQVPHSHRGRDARRHRGQAARMDGPRDVPPHSPPRRQRAAHLNRDPAVVQAELGAADRRGRRRRRRRQGRRTSRW